MFSLNVGCAAPESYSAQADTSAGDPRPDPPRRPYDAAVLKKLRNKLSQTVEQLDEERLQSRYEALDTIAIGSAPLRERVVVGGEIQGLQVVPRAGSPSLEVTISDGTGRAVAVFTGRKRLGGIDPGRTIVVEGVGRQERGRMLLVNPAYTLF